MISGLRDVLKGPMKWVAIFIVVVAFAFVGTFDAISFGSPSLLKVGKAKYSPQEVTAEFDRSLERLRRENDAQITKSDAIRFGLLEQTLNRLALRGALEQETEKLGMTASTEQVRKVLNEDEGFHNPSSGKFDAVVLTEILRNNNLTVSQFERILAGEIVQSQLVNAAGAPVSAPAYFTEAIMLRENEIRTVSYAVFDASHAGEVPEPDEADLQAFYEERRSALTTPEYRRFSVAWFRPENFTDGLSVSEEELERLYELRKRALDKPETRTLRLMNVETELEATALADRLENGGNFATIAKEKGRELASLTYESRSKGDMLDAAVNEAAFDPELEEGAFFGPVDGLTGWYIGEIVSITPAETTSFEEQRAALEAEAMEDETTRLLNDALDLFEDERDSGATLKEALAATGGTVKLETYGPVSADMQIEGGAIITDIPYDFVREAYTLEPGEESDLLTLNDETRSYYVVMLDEVIDPVTTPFETARKGLVTSWKDRWLKDTIAEKSRELREAVLDGATFEDAAAEANVTVLSVTLPRGSGHEDIPRSMMGSIFNTPLGGVVTGVDFNGLKAYTARIDDASFRTSLQGDAIADLMRTSFGQQISSELFETYVATLEEDLGVSRNEELLERYFPTLDE